MPFSSNPLLSQATAAKARLTNQFNAARGKPPGAGKVSSIKKVTALTLQDIKNLDRPAPSWRWNLVMPPLPGITAEQMTPKKSILSFLNKPTQSNLIVCESIEIPPTINLGQQTRFFKGHNVQFPNVAGYDTVTAVFYESERYSSLHYFKAWQEAVYDPKHRVYGVPANYGWNVDFYALPITDYEDVQRYTEISLRTCWPINVQKLSYGNTTDRIKMQVEFAFHKLEVNIVGGGASSTKLDAGSVVNSVRKYF